MVIDRWMDKEDMLYKYTMGCYSAVDKNKVMPFAGPYMNLEVIILLKNEVSQKEKDKYHMISLMCGI